MMKALGSPLSNEELKDTLVESISEGRTKSCLLYTSDAADD